MKDKKILIASGLLAVAGIAAFVFYRRSAPSTTTQLPATLNPTPSGGSTTTQTSSPAPQRVSSWPEGTLLRHGSNDKVFVIDALGYRHWISNRGYFDKQGYSMTNVKSISLSEMIAIPEGSPLSGLSGITRA